MIGVDFDPVIILLQQVSDQLQLRTEQLLVGLVLSQSYQSRHQSFILGYVLLVLLALAGLHG